MHAIEKRNLYIPPFTSIFFTIADQYWLASYGR